MKLIGLKELQQNTKEIREQVSRGMRYIVVYRSKPIFEISPIDQNTDFSAAFKSTNLYKSDFIARMEEAESDVKSGRIKRYDSESITLLDIGPHDIYRKQ